MWVNGAPLCSQWCEVYKETWLYTGLYFPCWFGSGTVYSSGVWCGMELFSAVWCGVRWNVMMGAVDCCTSILSDVRSGARVHFPWRRLIRCSVSMQRRIVFFYVVAGSYVHGCEDQNCACVLELRSIFDLTDLLPFLLSLSSHIIMQPGKDLKLCCYCLHCRSHLSSSSSFPSCPSSLSLPVTIVLHLKPRWKDSANFFEIPTRTIILACISPLAFCVGFHGIILA